MSLTGAFSRLLGLETAESIEAIRPSLAASWAEEGAAWLLFGCLALAALAVVFYTLLQRVPRRRARIALAVGRAVLLCLILLLLAEPTLTIEITGRFRPALWVLVDGTESMAMVDKLSPEKRAQLEEAVGPVAASAESGSEAAAGQPLPGAAEAPATETPSSPAETNTAGSDAARSTGPARIDYIRALLATGERPLLEQLAERFRIRLFRFDRREGASGIGLSPDVPDKLDPAHVAAQLSADGELTALGAAVADLARRRASGDLAGLVVLSDFNQNAGPSAVDAATRLDAPVYAVAVGPDTTVDISVDLQAPLLMKKDEQSTLTATLRQQGLEGRSVAVRFLAQPLGEQSGQAEPKPIAQREVTLTGSARSIEVPFVPRRTGRTVVSVEVEPLVDEAVRNNNVFRRVTKVRDDFLRLLFVEYEPTWEWRFIKEVFHRDKLVGQRGFRTFLRSADPKVRQTNPLFLPTLSASRAEFFAHDVIFLGDMPASALSPRFCQLTKEFVSEFGGGLVVIAGPRFGPGALAGTPLAELLPVKLDPNARIREREPFALQLTPQAAQYDFMQLGGDPAQTQRAWANLGPLPWYQPVLRLGPVATALAVHPRDRTVDGESPQPLVAAHYFGRGEVVYLAFNETWRLRRGYGNALYRKFWGQMIHRLALRHALGNQKRFVVRTDRQEYRPEEQVIVTVEAYDSSFQPLSEDDVPGKTLQAQLVLPAGGRGAPSVRELSIGQLRRGVFEAQFPALLGGQHVIRVKDPVTDQWTETAFQVNNVSLERQRPVRNAALAQAVAEATGGRMLDLADAASLDEILDVDRRTTTSVEVVPLWDTWLCFLLVIALMLGEWLGRKWVNLP
jgi:ribosomal protein S18 acetylase RimI-like enzyme